MRSHEWIANPVPVEPWVCSESRQCTLGPAHVETRARVRHQCSPANRTLPKACTGELGAEKGLFFVATLDVMWIGNSFPVWMVGVLWCLQTCRMEEGEQLPHTKGPAFLCSRSGRITELCWNTGFILFWLNIEASWRIGMMEDLLSASGVTYCLKLTRIPKQKNKCWYGLSLHAAPVQILPINIPLVLL